MAATLAPALAIDAKKRNRLGVVLSLLNTAYETTVTVIAAMDIAAPVRSIVMRVLVCSALSLDPSSLDSMMGANEGRYLYTLNDSRGTEATGNVDTFNKSKTRTSIRRRETMAAFFFSLHWNETHKYISSRRPWRHQLAMAIVGWRRTRPWTLAAVNQVRSHGRLESCELRGRMGYQEKID